MCKCRKNDKTIFHGRLEKRESGSGTVTVTGHLTNEDIIKINVNCVFIDLDIVITQANIGTRLMRSLTWMMWFEPDAVYD